MLTEPLTKVCTSCGEGKELHEYRYKKGGRHLKHSFCKSCEAKKQKAYREKLKGSNFEAYYLKLQERELKAKYALSLSEYYLMWEEQDGVCAICKTTCSKNLAVDHDHTTGKLRGLLCQKCNRGLGLFNDNFKLLEDAIKYLEKYKNGYTSR